MNVNAQPKPTHFVEALEVLGKYVTKKIGNNTYLESHLEAQPNYACVRLGFTEIIRFYHSAITVLNIGTRGNRITIERINRYLPFGCHLYQLDGQLIYMPIDGKDIKFYDGMTVNSISGAVLTKFNFTEADEPK